MSARYNFTVALNQSYQNHCGLRPCDVDNWHGRCLFFDVGNRQMLTITGRRKERAHCPTFEEFLGLWELVTLEQVASEAEAGKRKPKQQKQKGLFDD